MVSQFWQSMNIIQCMPCGTPCKLLIHSNFLSPLCSQAPSTKWSGTWHFQPMRDFRFQWTRSLKHLTQSTNISMCRSSHLHPCIINTITLTCSPPHPTHTQVVPMWFPYLSRTVENVGVTTSPPRCPLYIDWEILDFNGHKSSSSGVNILGRFVLLHFNFCLSSNDLEPVSNVYYLMINQMLHT